MFKLWTLNFDLPDLPAGGGDGPEGGYDPEDG